MDWWLQSRATRNLEGIVTGNTPMMPTPNARDWKGPSGKNYGSGGLPEMASSLFPTPNARDYKGGNAAIGRTESGKRMRTEGQIDFAEAVKLLPTPDTGQTPNGHGRRGGSLANGHQSGASLDVVVKELLPTPVAKIQGKSTRALTASTENGRRSGGGQSSSLGLEEVAQLASGVRPAHLPPDDQLPPSSRRVVDSLLPTPSAGVFNDGEDLQSWAERRERNLAKGINGNGQGTPLSIAVQAAERDAEPASPWGRYAAAIERWEAVLGRPSPPPTEQGKTGPRLSPRFTEFVMGLPDGWVTDVPGVSRREQLHCLGNGVVPQQAALALRILLGET